MSGRPAPARGLWWLGAGFAVWCVALVVLYALHAVGCIFGWPAGPLRLVLGVALLANLAVIGWMWRRFAASAPAPGAEPGGAFLHTAAQWTLAAALAATAITFGPPLLLVTCL